MPRALRKAARAAAALLAAGAVALLVRAGLLPRPWPLPGPAAAPPPAEDRVAEGVTLWGRDLSGLSRQQVRAWLEETAGRVARDPVPARLDPETRGVLPELSGVRLDVDATLEAVAGAAPGSRVEPRYRWLPAPTTLAEFPLAPIYQGNPARSQVTLLVNVAWGNDELAEMLDLFDQHGVRTTFFLVGRWAERFPELARAVAERGHEIANHGYSDAVHIGRLRYDEARADLERAHQVLVRVTGQAPRYFSPHRGELSDALLEACRDLGYRLILWSVDTIDWQDPDRGTLLRRVLGRVQPGSLILMHPRRVTVDALPQLIAGLRQRGLEPVPLGRLLDPHLEPAPPVD